MNQTGKPVSSQRNYGIDLLRLVAVFYVALIHTITLGGLFRATTPLSYQELTCRMLLIISFCCVNIFGIISGYVGYREPLKEQNYLGYFPVWFTVVFYGFGFTCIYQFFFPETSVFFVKSLFPLTSDLYWYFSGYTFVYFLSPYLNKILYHSSDRELKKLFFLICVFFITVEYIGGSFEMGGGYTGVWLLLLYLVGGILKKTGIGSRIPSYALLLAVIVVDVIFFYCSYKWSIITISIFAIDFSVSGSLTNPFYLAAGILHVMLFSRFHFSEFWKKVIKFAAPAAFSVYIVNTYPPFWDYALRGCLGVWAASSPVGIFARTVLFSAGFVFVVTIVDFFRRKLFRLIGVQNWPYRILGLFKKKKVS